MVDVAEESRSSEEKYHESSPPDLMRLIRRLRGSLGVVEIAVVGIFIIALLFAIDVASAFFIPLVLAFLLDRLFTPPVRRLRSLGIPSPVGAGVVMIFFIGSLGVGLYYLSGPAADWLERAPRQMQIAEYKLRGLKKPLQKMQEAAQEVEKATKMEGQEQTVQVQQRSMSEALMGQTQSALSGALIMLFLLYFLLAVGDLFLNKLVRVLPRFRHRRNAVRIVRSTESQLSRYLGTMALINMGLGIAVGIALYLLGMPNPVLWGVLAALLNFVPYLGPLVNVLIVGLVAIVTFDSVEHMVLPPLAYMLLNGLEASLVTPTVMGWQLQLNPVIIFIALTFWTWMWGIPGALLAVPLLTTFKIICDNVEVLQPVGEFLGQ